MTWLALAQIFPTLLVSSVLIIIIIIIIRYAHSSWASPSGLMLLGGTYNSRTTKVIIFSPVIAMSLHIEGVTDLAKTDLVDNRLVLVLVQLWWRKYVESVNCEPPTVYNNNFPLSSIIAFDVKLNTFDKYTYLSYMSCSQSQLQISPQLSCPRPLFSSSGMKA